MQISKYKNSDAYVRLHLAIFLAGGTGLFGRLISIGELPLVCIRVIMASIILALVMASSKNLGKISKNNLLKIMGCGVLLSIHWVFYYGSIKAANVSIGAVCFALVGFFTAIIEPIIHRHRPSWKELLLSILTVAGVGIIFGFDARYRIGIGLGIISSLLFTLFSLSSKSVQASTQERSSTMLLYEMIGGAIILIILLPFYSMIFPQTKIIPDTHDFWYLLLFASVFTIVPFLLQLQALRSISAFTVNLSYNLEPVYTILLAIVILGEAKELNASFWIGISLIILSVVLQTILSIANSKKISSKE